MTKKESKQDTKTLEAAHQRFELAQEAENKFRQDAKEDLAFLEGDQWTEEAKKTRKAAGLPVFTVNKMKTYLQQITNEMRQNKPSIQIDPTSGDATKDVADIYAGIIKFLESESGADTAYDTAAKYSATTGLGYIMVGSEYVNYTNNEQKLVIKTIADPSTVFYDPSSKEEDGSDAEWCFITVDMDKDEYNRTYGDSELATAFSNQTSSQWTGPQVKEGWKTESTIRVAEYWYKEYEKKTLYTVQVTDRQVDPNTGAVTGNQTIEFNYAAPPAEVVNAGLAEVITSREVQIPTVKRCLLNGCEILKETTWPGKYLPIVPVYGNVTWVDGKRHVSGAISAAKDSQRTYNYLVSTQTEILAMVPKAPYIGGKGFAAGFERLWRESNVRPTAYLEFNDKDKQGNPIAAPARQTYEAPIQAVAASRLQAGNDIQDAFGIYNDQKGEATNAESGKAILARTTQSQTTNYHYYDNLIRSVTHVGRILVDCIPIFYDTERMIKIVKPDGQRAMVAINTIKDGQAHNSLDTGTYDVAIETGPSYATRRQEAVETMTTLVTAYPNAAPALADLIVAQMDWPESSKCAARLKAMVPPEILAATGEDDHDKMEPEAVVQALKQQVQQMKQDLQNLNGYAAQQEQLLKIAKEENDLLKKDKSIEAKKADQDFHIKTRAQDIDVSTARAEFVIEQEKIKIQRRQLDMKEKEMEIKLAEAMAGINSDMHDKAQAHHSMTMPSIEIDDGVSDPDLGGKFGSEDLGTPDA